MTDVAEDRTNVLWSTVPAETLKRWLNIARRAVAASTARLEVSGETIASSPGHTAAPDGATTLQTPVPCPDGQLPIATLIVACEDDRAWTGDERESLDEIAAALADAASAHCRASHPAVNGARQIRAAADELRAPLQTIVGMTEFLKRETQPEVIAARADALQSIAASLLSTLDGPPEPAREKDDAAEFVTVQSFAEECLASAGARGAEFTLSIGEGVPARAGFDSSGAKRALHIVLSACEPGDVSVEIVRSGNALRFNVSGPHGADGGSPSQADQQRSAGAVEAVVQSFAGESGSSIRPGGATTIFFTAPARWEADETFAEAAHILVADDLDLNRKLISDMLSIEGHSVDSVADGASAVKAASECSYDLILMDMIMPGMDGVAATRAIRALPSPACRVPIVALTAHSLPEQLDSCLQAGMDATLTKPMTLDALIGAVETWTRRGRKAA